MIPPDLWFENRRQGQRARLVGFPGETGGRRFVLEYVYEPFSGEAAVPAHLHPTAQETFAVLSGRGRHRVASHTATLETGQQAVLPTLFNSRSRSTPRCRRPASLGRPSGFNASCSAHWQALVVPSAIGPRTRPTAC